MRDFNCAYVSFNAAILAIADAILFSTFHLQIPNQPSTALPDLDILQRLMPVHRGSMAACAARGSGIRCSAPLFAGLPRAGRRLALVTIVWLTLLPTETRVDQVNVDLDFDQLAELELISLHVGKPPAQLLMEAAQLVLTRDAHLSDLFQPREPQRVLPEEDMELRLAQLLRR
jgi:hypothetical protein